MQLRSRFQRRSLLLPVLLLMQLCLPTSRHRLPTAQTRCPSSLLLHPMLPRLHYHYHCHLQWQAHRCRPAGCPRRRRPTQSQQQQQHLQQSALQQRQRVLRVTVLAAMQRPQRPGLSV